jgi:2'-5' RNA ligase
VTGPPHPATSAGRLFLGVALTDQARSAVRLQLATETLPGRVVSPDDWHLTVRFLGDTPSAVQERLRELLGTADLGPGTDIVFGRLGAFPRPDRAAVLWLGVDEGAAALTALAARVDEAVRAAGFPAETRPYAPHLTLSRLRPPVDARLLVGRVPPVRVRMAVDAVVLFRTRQGSGPGRYEEIERFPLSHPPEDGRDRQISDRGGTER